MSRTSLARSPWPMFPSTSITMLHAFGVRSSSPPLSHLLNTSLQASSALIDWRASAVWGGSRNCEMSFRHFPWTCSMILSEGDPRSSNSNILGFSMPKIMAEKGTGRHNNKSSFIGQSTYTCTYNYWELNKCPPQCKHQPVTFISQTAIQRLMH